MRSVIANLHMSKQRLSIISTSLWCSQQRELREKQAHAVGSLAGKLRHMQAFRQSKLQ